MEEKQKKRIKINKTWILITVLVAITGGLLAISLSSKNPISNTSKNAKNEAKKDLAHTSLEFSNILRTSTSSAKQDVDIIINTNGDKVTFTQLELSYNPKLLTSVDINPGTFFNNPQIVLKEINPASGRITYWLGISQNQKGIAGEGPVAVISFIKVGSAPAQINFMPKTSVQASGTNQSVLKNMVSGFIGDVVPSTTRPTSSNSATTGAR